MDPDAKLDAYPVNVGYVIGSASPKDTAWMRIRKSAWSKVACLLLALTILLICHVSMRPIDGHLLTPWANSSGCVFKVQGSSADNIPLVDIAKSEFVSSILFKPTEGSEDSVNITTYDEKGQRINVGENESKIMFEYVVVFSTHSVFYKMWALSNFIFEADARNSYNHIHRSDDSWQHGAKKVSLEDYCKMCNMTKDEFYSMPKKRVQMTHAGTFRHDSVTFHNKCRLDDWHPLS